MNKNKTNLAKTTRYTTESTLDAIVERGVYRNGEGPLFYTGYVTDAQGCKIPQQWTPEGVAIGFSPDVHKYDIVSVVKPTVDWDKLPEYVKFVAMDSDEDWAWFTHRPYTGLCTWCCDIDIPFSAKGYFDSDREGVAFEFSGDWKDSLVERPAVTDVPAAPVMDIPWGEIPEEYSVVAFDAEGWWAYTRIPTESTTDEEHWHVAHTGINFESFELLDIDLPDYPGDWKDSIHIRPGSNPVRDYE